MPWQRVFLGADTTSPAPLARPQVDPLKVESIISHRWNPSARQREEAYLVEWIKDTPTTFKTFSWHSINELEWCLAKVQLYISGLQQRREQRQLTLTLPQSVNGHGDVQLRSDSASRKRKSPSSDVGSSSSSSSRSFVSSELSITRQRTSFETQTVVSISSDDDEDVKPAPPTTARVNVPPQPNWMTETTYNGDLEVVAKSDTKFLHMKPWPTPLTPNQRLTSTLPTTEMTAHALSRLNITSRAEYAIQKAFSRNLARLNGPPVTLHAVETMSAPPLQFRFIEANVLGKDVQAAEPDFVVGCGQYREQKPGQHGYQACRPHMGQHQGCEYSRICECLEFAPVDESRLREDQRERLDAGELMGLPKRFPYSGPTSQNPYALTPFYLEKRDMIYECNRKCACGAGCKTRVVQHGRSIPLQIFKTEKRGWGLRCPAPLRRGQFIDTYRGEIITNAEAQRREEAAQTVAGAAKDCYLYDLDKHEVDEAGGLTADDYYVIDGECVGGPTRFMNHSCAPNCGQYCVSMNKYDQRIYELAFFALRDIAPGEELTFDYLDVDADDEDSERVEGDSAKRVPCLCGASNCRKFLWT